MLQKSILIDQMGVEIHDYKIVTEGEKGDEDHDEKGGKTNVVGDVIDDWL